MKNSLAALFGLALSIVSAPAFAAYDAFLKIDGIAGESTNAGHVGWIDIVSFSTSERTLNGGSQGSGAGSGKVKFNPITITRKVDKASPLLFQAVAKGTHFSRVIIEFTNEGSHAVVWRATLTDALVASATRLPPRGGGDDSPTEKVVLNFTDIELMIRSTNGDGTLGAWSKVDPNDAKSRLPKIFVRATTPAVVPSAVRP